MTKDKIHIRVELSKDGSGNLSLATVFDEKSPNFKKDEEGYYWIPTTEETEFLNDAFNMLPSNQKNTKKTTSSSSSSESGTINKTTISEIPVKEEKIEEKPEQKIENETPEQIKKDILEPEIKEKIETKEKEEKEPAVFEVTDEEQINQDEKETSENKEKDEESEHILVKADEEAIEAAIRKKQQEKNSDMVEADERTIIDKVLSQKKKGRWTKKDQ